METIVSLVVSYLASLNFITKLSLGLFTIYLLAKTSRFINFYIKCGLYLLILLITSLVGVVLSVVFRLTNKATLTHLCVGRFFAYSCNLILNIEYEVENETCFEAFNNKPFVLACNHQSVLDIAPMGRITPLNCAVMVKRSLRLVPLFVMCSNVIFINKSNKLSAIQTTEKLAQEMIKRQIGVYVFVEGTRSGFEEPNLLPFKKGPFHLAINAKAAIIPVVFSNTSKIFNYKRRIFDAGVIKIKVLDPIQTTGYTIESVSELVNKTRDCMLKTHKEISIEKNNFNIK